MLNLKQVRARARACDWARWRACGRPGQLCMHQRLRHRHPFCRSGAHAITAAASVIAAAPAVTVAPDTLTAAAYTLTATADTMTDAAFSLELQQKLDLSVLKCIRLETMKIKILRMN